jgi:hypothetical protein
MTKLRRREVGDPHALRQSDTTALQVSFTITARTRSGRFKTTLIRVLTTLLDHQARPARDIAALYAGQYCAK